LRTPAQSNAAIPNNLLRHELGDSYQNPISPHHSAGISKSHAL
jgi:hypothetical protein